MRSAQLTLLAAVMMFLSASALRAEYVFLKDGAIIKCTVESETPKGMLVRLPSGKTMTISNRDILRTLYTELYMGKIHIQKVDGTSVDAYQVDEDQQSITFRKEINKPEEFTLKRDDILFTTRSNPVGLEGAAETDHIVLKWKPPYTKAKEYNVYIKSDKTYILAGKSGSPGYTLRGVKSNTAYAIKVTAVDNEGIESLPTNEIKIKTRNIPPVPPSHLKIEVRSDNSVYLTWEAGLSVDGKIKGYRILEKQRSGFSETGFAVKNEYEARYADKGVHEYVLRTVDVNGWESGDSSVVSTLPLRIDFSLEGSYIIPFGKFKDINKFGYGGIFRAVKPDILFYNFELGIACGYWQFKGTEKVDSSYMVPALLTAGYRFNIGRLTITPRIAGGISYNYLSYTTRWLQKRTSSEIDPLVMGGLNLNCVLTDRISFFVGGDYARLFQKSDAYQFAVCNAGLAVRF